MAKIKDKIHGKIVDSKIKKGLSDLRVEAWGKIRKPDARGGVEHRTLGSAVTKNGDFSISLDQPLLDRLTEWKSSGRIYFKIFHDDKEIHITKEDPFSNYVDPTKVVTIQIDWELQQRYMVSGYIRTTDGAPIRKISVKAFDRKLQKITPLGEATTDDSGYYKIDYTDKLDSSQKSQTIDLFIQAKLPEQEQLYKSEVIFNAPAEAEVNLNILTEEVPRHLYFGPSEFEKHDAAISELIKDHDVVMLEKDDIEYVAVKLKLSLAKVERYIHALRLDADATQYKETHAIPTAIFYGVIDDGHMPELASLVSQSRQNIKQSLQQAAQSNVIPIKFEDEEQILTFVDTLKEIAVVIAEKDTIEPEAYSVKNILEVLDDLSINLKSKFVRTHALRETDMDTFWKKIKKDVELKGYTNRIRDLFTLADLTLENLPLIRQLELDRKDNTFEGLTLISDLGRWDKEDWNKYLRADQKRPVNPKTGKQYSLIDYAAELDRHFSAAFPAVDLVSRLEKTKILTRKNKPSEAFSKFVDQHSGLNFRKISVNRYLEDAGVNQEFKEELEKATTEEERKQIKKQQTALVKELRHNQLACVLAPESSGYDGIAALREFSLNVQGKTVRTVTADSVVKIAGMNKADFIGKWRELRKNGGITDEAVVHKEVEEIYQRARYHSFHFMVDAWNASDALRSITPAFVSNPSTSAKIQTRSPGGYSQIADLSTLFGSQHYCECRHCHSNYGPAAYLAQLYDALSKDARGELKRRRPDIELLHLNCENTNTKLPYIDLILEQLELLVSILFSSSTIDLSDIEKLQTTLTEKELALRPEHEFSLAYAVLSVFPYPLSVPWDKWFDEARRYLDYMGLPLYRLIEIFTPAMGEEEGPSDYLACRQAQLRSKASTRALLGLPEPVYDLISKPMMVSSDNKVTTYFHDEDDLRYLFGLYENDLTEIRTLGSFMHHLGFWLGNEKGDTGAEDFTLFRRMLGTRYVQDSREHSDLIDVAFSDTSPCNVDEAKITNLTHNTLVRITKFEHLRRALKWTPGELNQAILVFSKFDMKIVGNEIDTDALDEDVLAQISHLVRIKERRPEVSVMELLSWWGMIDTGAGVRKIPPFYEGELREPDQISLYEKVFLDKSLFSSNNGDTGTKKEWSYFRLNEATKTEMEYLENASTEPEPIAKHKSTITAALQISETELNELTNFVLPYFPYLRALRLHLKSLSVLYRVVSLTRFLNLSIHEFVLVHAMIGNGLDPFSGSQPETAVSSDINQHGPTLTEHMLLFIECVEKIQRSPFEIRDIAYLWHHHVESEQELDHVRSQIDNYLSELTIAFQSSETDIPLTETDFHSSDIENVSESIGLHKSDIEQLSRIIRDGSVFFSRDKALLNRALHFLPLEERNTLEKLLITDTPVDIKEYSTIMEYLTRAYSKLLILGQSLEGFLELPGRMIRQIVAVVLHSTNKEDGTPQTSDALCLDFYRWRDKPEDYKAIVQSHLLRLQKIAIIVNKWGLTGDEIVHVQRYKSDFRDFDWNAIPIYQRQRKRPAYQEWAALSDYVEVRNGVGVKKNDLLELFVTGWNPQQGESVLQKLQILLNYKESENNQLGAVKEIVRQLGYLIEDSNSVSLKGKALRNGETIIPIIEMVEAIKRSGRSFQVVRNWVYADMQNSKLHTLDAAFLVAEEWPVPVDIFDLSSESSLYPDHIDVHLLTYKERVVEEIRNSVRAWCSDDQWQEVARQFQDEMRILQRDKLVDFIVIWLRASGHIVWDPFTKPEDIYDYLLIDPLVNPCMDTTRLKQAISSVQLFIHRILMGLESEMLYDDLEDTLAEDWNWKKNYRVWEAHKKVFLYPENWIEPELRDNKTPFFEAFESELSQSEIDDKSIEKAFKNYLRKVDEVGNLEIATFKEEIKDNGFKELHVIGRTRDKPRTHYYRKRNENDIWLPWERIDLDIDSEVVLLTVYNGAPHIFWPTVKERIEKLGQDNPNDKNNEKNNYRPVFAIRFNWSSYRDDRWAARKKTDDDLVLMYSWRYKELFKDPESLITYDIVVTTNNNVDEKIVIGANCMAEGFEGDNDELLRYTWNDEILEEKFDRLQSVVGEVDWNEIQGEYFRSTTEDMLGMVKPSVDLAKQQLKQSLYAGKDDITNHITMARNLANISLQPVAFSNNTLALLPMPIGILRFPLFDYPKLFNNRSNNSLSMASNVNNTTGLKQNDILNKVVPRFIEFSTISDNTIQLEGGKNKSLDISEPNLGKNKTCRFGEFEFRGYKLESKAFNSLGLVEIWRNGSWTEVLSQEEKTRDLPRFEDYRVLDEDSPYGIGDYGINKKFIFDTSLKRNQVEFNYAPSLKAHDLTTAEGQAAYSLFLANQYLFHFDYLEKADPKDLESITFFKTKEYSTSATVTLRDRLDFEEFFYHDPKHCYYFKKEESPLLNYTGVTFHHPFIGDFNTVMNSGERFRERCDSLFRLDKQNITSDFPYSWKPGYRLKEGETQRVRFDFCRPFGLYNWEIFFHIPFTVAVRLSQNKKFAEAQQWFHYIFNPLASLSNGNITSTDQAARYWNFLPLHKIEDWPYDQADEKAEFAKDPFQPHRIARLRLVAYQKAVVMKYLDNLIAWGDYLFEQDTIESINEATHLYVLAGKILGERPKLVPKQMEKQASSGAGSQYRPTTVQGVASYSVDMVAVEQEIIYSEQQLSTPVVTMPNLANEVLSMQWFRGLPPSSDQEEDPLELDDLPDESVFCVPHNEKLISYWDEVADRLFKIRNCRNIEGQLRELPIFEPPIDPGLLVRGQALGIDISELLSDLYTPLPPYRFRVLLQKAYEFCADVRSLGGALLSALEKKDAEELSLLRSGHERQMLKLVKDVKRQQIRELRENLKSAQTSLEMAEGRFDYYSSRRFENRDEKAQVKKLDRAIGFQVAGQIHSVAAALAHIGPEVHTNTTNGITTLEWGGTKLGNALNATASFLNMISGIYSHEANMHSIQGGRERRMDDWKFQATQARKEMKQVEKQILAAEIRLDIAERELLNHQKQQDQAEEIAAFMQSKFTNKELYHWMASQVSGLYFQTYKMSADLAKMAQKCFRHERGGDAVPYIGAAHWDNLKKGLLAGEKLQFDLRRMENDYLLKNKRELELTKNISLRALDPLQLDELRYTGKCLFTIPELLFDLDHPGHYYRRIKSLSISIPSVVGPYSGVNCTLKLLSSSTRKVARLGDTYLKPDQTRNENKVALSSGQNDTGLFELNHNDERYLPFELCGVDSKWELEFPSSYEQFDRSSISDVILHMRYTALMSDDLPKFKDDVNSNIKKTYNKEVQKDDTKPLGLRIDIRREFPDLWQKFISSPTSGPHELTLTLTKEHFPYLLRPLEVSVTHMTFFCELKESLENETLQIHVNKLKTSSDPVTFVDMTKESTGKYFKSVANEAQDGFVLSLPNVNIELNINVNNNNFTVDNLKELIVVLHYEIVDQNK